ncbi:TPA: hypothetical protein RG862_003686 [Enterobacter ludwigii]|nr:hypothetical protein [Enterobacter ludwigii]
MKTKYIIHYSAGALISSVFIMLGYWYSHHNLRFACSSSTASFYTNNDNKSFLDFTQNITFSYWGKATVSLSGNLYTTEGKMYVINRSVFYDYEHIGASQYRLKVTGAMSYGNDSVPVSLERKHLMPILKDVSRVMGIRHLANGDVMFFNNAGPFFICAVH